MMDRTPPIAVRRYLRREVGFGCPVPGCGNPYLYWHHFDPPWNERPHHDPAGMIALCGEHHAKADAGAFTEEQFHDFKRRGVERAEEVRGRFDWMRRSLLAFVGGSFYYETPVIFQFRGEPAIWFSRDEEEYLLLNVRMLTVSGQRRLRIEENFWLARGDPEDLECPPSGRLLHVRYPNGDDLRVEFFELEAAAAVRRRYPDAQPEEWGIPFPVTAVEVHKTVGGTNIGFGPRETTLGGLVIRNAFMCRVGVAISIE